MQHFNYEERWREISCYVPVYDQEYGNCTEIWLDNAEKIKVPVKVENVTAHLAEVFSLNLSGLKKRYRRILKKGKLVPLPLHPELVIVPLKVRNPIIRDDGASGYAIFNRVAAYDVLCQEDYLSKITLTNGLTLKTYHTLDTVEERLMAAEKALKKYRHLYLIKTTPDKPSKLEEGKVFYLVTDCPDFFKK